MPAAGAPADLDRIIKLAILAVGGQGGGVLTAWITDLAEANGYAAQATSVAGVAQRTGATIYYIEMMPKSDRQPVFALAPAPGDVDIVIAAELMEAGRAMLRGFVTPDRTTLIASEHRALATTEKTAPGDGIGDGARVRARAAERAKRLIAFDMEAIAQDTGSVISASLFGALAASGSVPFLAERFRDTIRGSGRGVEASLRAFDAALARAGASDPVPAPPIPTALPTPRGTPALLARWRVLERRLADLPAPAQDLAGAGLRKVVDFQDLAYGAEYLDQVRRVWDVDRQAGGDAHAFALTAQAAKHLANAMAYDDILRVADLKTRKARFERVFREARATEATVLEVTEYVHPGPPELISLLPAGLGAWTERQRWLVALLDRMTRRGQRIRTSRLGGFLVFYGLSALRPWRRGLLRHRIERAHWTHWLDTALDRARGGAYGTAVGLIKARRLIKGYSDTHARGLGKFDRVTAALMALPPEPGADGLAIANQLIQAALDDVEGTALDAAITDLTRGV